MRDKTYHYSKNILGIVVVVLLINSMGVLGSSAQEEPLRVYVDTAYTAQSSGGHSFGVDAFADIQSGVDAVAAGGTVNIMAGVYDEQIIIDGKSVTLKGAGDSTIVRPSVPDKLISSYVYPNNLPIWSAVKVAGIIIVRNTGVSDVTIKDLKVDGINITTVPAGAQRLTGIIYGESAGTIQNVTLETIRTTGITDRTYGIDAIAVGSPVSIKIIGNRVTDFLRNGIQVIGESLTVDISDNTIIGPTTLPGVDQVPNGIALLYGPRGVIRGNTISRFHSPNDSWRASGVLLYGETVTSVEVKENDVSDADYGIIVSTGVDGSMITNNKLHGNKSGVMLESGVTNNLVISNNITGNIQGIQIHGVLNSNLSGNQPPGDGNVIKNNTITENQVGIISFDDTQTFEAKDNWWGSA